MLSLGLSMIVVDATIVNVAVPSIVRDLKLDGSAAEWIVSIYPLVFAALLISFGRFGDVAGRRRLFLLGLGIFTDRVRPCGPRAERIDTHRCPRSPGRRWRRDRAGDPVHSQHDLPGP